MSNIPTLNRDLSLLAPKRDRVGGAVMKAILFGSSLIAGGAPVDAAIVPVGQTEPSIGSATSQSQ